MNSDWLDFVSKSLKIKVDKLKFTTSTVINMIDKLKVNLSNLKTQW